MVTIIAPHKYIRWIREDVVLMDTRQPDLLLPDRVTVFANGSLQVSNVQYNDTAEYVCEMGTATGVATQTHAIEVQCKCITFFFTFNILKFIILS